MAVPISSPTKAKKKRAICFDEFIEQCKAAGEKPIPSGYALFDWTKKAGIPYEFVELAWLEFKERYQDEPDKTLTGIAGWRKRFGQAVRQNWFELWYFKQTGDIRTCTLTTIGEAHRRAKNKTGAHAAPEYQTV